MSHGLAVALVIMAGFDHVSRVDVLFASAAGLRGLLGCSSACGNEEVLSHELLRGL